MISFNGDILGNIKTVIFVEVIIVLQNKKKINIEDFYQNAPHLIANMANHFLGNINNCK